MQHQRKGEPGNSSPRDEDAHVGFPVAVRVRETDLSPSGREPCFNSMDS